MNGAKRAFPFLVLNKCKCLRGSRKRQNVSRGTCGTPANAKKFLERLAGLPQRPKSFPRDLRGSRKGQKVSRETCGAPAKAKKFSERLAGLPQTPKSFSRDLRDSRKRQKVFRETCGTPANTSKKFLGFAEFLQERFFPFWCLQNFCKSAFPHFGVCRTSARALFPILVFATPSPSILRRSAAT